MPSDYVPALCSLEEFLKYEFDFIVVGGGTAGLVIAARLTENNNITVGVLEAGLANLGDPLIMTPAAYTQTFTDPKYDWCHSTVPQHGVSANKIKDMPRGKCLGGSSAINFEMYVRGETTDYDDWEKLGNKGWGFKELLPYFKKHETFQLPETYLSSFNIPLETPFVSEYHGTTGPIQTSFSTWRAPFEKEWIEASASIEPKGRLAVDPFSGNHLGAHHSLSSIDRKTGTRSYAVTGYLLPNGSRPNLRVLTEALVTKLVVSDDGSVTGVEFQHSQEKHVIRSKKEVIVSAGAVKSPHVLELSGIGNPQILSKAGIKCVVENSRVGENFQDHGLVAMGWEVVEGEKTLDNLKNPEALQEAMAEYTTKQSGPLANPGATMAFASYADMSTPEELAALKESIMSHQPTSYNEAARRLIADGFANAQYSSIHFASLGAAIDFTTSTQKIMMAGDPDMAGKQGFTIAVYLTRSLSVGSCHAISADPTVDPAIDPAYLSHPADLEVLQKGIEYVERVVATSPFKEKIKRRYYPKEDTDFSSKKAREEYTRRTLNTGYHLSSSVAMGIEGVGAVDERLRVRGAKGLRVMDASVIPVHISGNMQSTVYAIAEKGADMLKEDWGL